LTITLFCHCFFEPANFFPLQKQPMKAAAFEDPETAQTTEAVNRERVIYLRIVIVSILGLGL